MAVTPPPRALPMFINKALIIRQCATLRTSAHMAHSLVYRGEGRSLCSVHRANKASVNITCIIG